MTNLAYEQLMNDKEVLAVLDKRYTARQKKIEDRKRAKAIYYMKQKLCGLVLVALGGAVPFINNGDATASLVLLPIGVYLMITKCKRQVLSSKKWQLISSIFWQLSTSIFISSHGFHRGNC